MGQNIRTSLAQQVAEELRVPLESVRIVMGDTDLTPWDAGTFGSRTTPTMGPQLRAAAATAREQLLDLAAERWKTDRAALKAADGKIANPAMGQALGYGELTRGQNLVKVIGADPLVASPRDWKLAGKPARKVDGRDFVTGSTSTRRIFPGRRCCTGWSGRRASRRRSVCSTRRKPRGSPGQSRAGRRLRRRRGARSLDRGARGRRRQVAMEHAAAAVRQGSL
jgi:hypothetical protein